MAMFGATCRVIDYILTAKSRLIPSLLYLNTDLELICILVLGFLEYLDSTLSLF